MELPPWFPRPASQRFNKLLKSHQSYDKGAFELAKILAQVLKCPLLAHTYSRLVIDCNRREGHPDLFGKFIVGYPSKTTLPKAIHIHRAYRTKLSKALDSCLPPLGPENFTPIHLSIHSFTPIYKGKRRETDVGILYDPKRPQEALLALKFKRAFIQKFPGLRVQFNKPYRGTDEGVAVWARENWGKGSKRFTALEWEFNQGTVVRWSAKRKKLLAGVFKEVFSAEFGL